MNNEQGVKSKEKEKEMSQGEKREEQGDMRKVQKSGIAENY